MSPSTLSARPVCVWNCCSNTDFDKKEITDAQNADRKQKTNGAESDQNAHARTDEINNEPKPLIHPN